MRVVTFTSQKGGSGKSSLAVSLAVVAQEAGLKVYVIDLDPQGTAKAWFERRAADLPEVAAIDSSRLAEALDVLRRQKVDLVIIDTAGHDAPGQAAAMNAADLNIIPARPSIADIEATRATVRTLNKLGRPFAYVLNQAPAGRSIRTSDAYRVLQLGGVVAPAPVGLRTDHLDALAMGLGVTERDPNGKAAGEVRTLFTWIRTRLEGKNGSEAKVARVA